MDEWQEARILSLTKGDGAASLVNWLDARRSESTSLVENVPLKSLRRWNLDYVDAQLVLGHDTGRFFSVEGRRVQTNFGFKSQWEQAIILQPERGLLGFIARIRRGVLEFLVQAKMEPGCINSIQASPTIQATRSNYSRIHQGKIPAYYEYFSDMGKGGQWIIRSAQVEQTTRFFAKKNFNALRIISDSSEVPTKEDFRWCTLQDLKGLYLYENQINMNARSILACIPPLVPKMQIPAEKLMPENQKIGEFLSALYASIAYDEAKQHKDIYDIMIWLEEMQDRYRVDISQVSLDKLENWSLDDSALQSDYFSVVGVHVVANREITEWDQPLIAQKENGISVLIGRTIDGVPHFLFQAKCDVGGDPPVHLAPTVSCSIPSQRQGTDEAPPFLDYVMKLEAGDFIFNVTLSEEGGRFQNCENDYKILWDENFSGMDIPDNYKWIAFESIFELVRHGCLNIEARSLMGFMV